MDKKEELKGLLKELVADEYKGDISDLQEKAAAQEELNIKTLEENTALKAQLDAMQDKKFTLEQNTGSNDYVFKGYDVSRTSKNFKMSVSEDMQKEVADYMVKALTSSPTGSYAIPVEYSNALLGLAELSSVALTKARVLPVSTNHMYLPAKNARTTVDSQAFGIANKVAAPTLRQIEFVIDKRIGSYEQVYNDLLADQMFDVVGQFIEPLMAEAIALNFDDEVFNTGGEFTSNITGGGTAGVTVSGSTAMAAAVTYANLVTLAYTVEMERGLTPEWYLPRGCMKDIVALVDNNGRPLFNPTPISTGSAGSLLGYNINIVTSISDTPANGAIRLCFGDLKHYTVLINGGVVFQVNPYAEMREAVTQFISYTRADGNVIEATAFSNLIRTDA